MDYSLILDVVIVVMLAGTIGAAFVLNRKLNALRQGRHALAQMIGDFQDMSGKVDRSVHSLSRSAQETAGLLQNKLETAQEMRDELQFIIESADNLANRLASHASGSRKNERGYPSEYTADMPTGYTDVGDQDDGGFRAHGREPLSLFGGVQASQPAPHAAPEIEDLR